MYNLETPVKATQRKYIVAKIYEKFQGRDVRDESGTMLTHKTNRSKFAQKLHKDL